MAGLYTPPTLPEAGRRLGDLLPEAGLSTAQAGITIRDLVQDSRQATPGSAFVALRGSGTHGLAHAADAVARGAVMVLWDEADAPPDARWPAARIPGLRARLPELAAALFGGWPADAPVVAVTGTDGKTTVTHLIAEALESLGRPAGLIGTLGVGRPGALRATGHTTPGVVDMHRYLARLAAQGCGAAVLEASSHGLAQGRLAGVPIRVAVLTRLGSDHLDFHGSQTAYAQAKAGLFRWPGLTASVLNADDDLGARLMASDPQPGVARWTYSAQGGRADLVAANLRTTPEGIAFTLCVEGREWTVSSPLFGQFQTGNLLATLAVLHTLGIGWEDAVAAVRDLPGVPGRMERFALPGGGLLVVDYAHTEQALAAALEALRPHASGGLWAVFGCGGDRDTGKRPAMGRAAAERADRVIVTDDNPRHEEPAAIRAAILAGCHGPATCREIPAREQAIRAAAEEARAGDVILVAGKGHETTQQIGDRHHPFSDRAIAQALSERNGAAGASTTEGDTR
ncbi:MAG: UDP-N-acetylmuramoyl-L-alanyl-D-glutamate--2,6-diaminopimelate ligase [Pseudomonadota bacterium]